MSGSARNLEIDLSWQLRSLLWLEGRSLSLWRKILMRRLLAGKESTRSVQEKLMEEAAAAPPLSASAVPLIWGHAVGVGEVLALLGLFKRLAESFPNCHFLLTSSSRTSGEAVAKQGLPERFHHRYSPIDHPEVLARFLDAWRPSVACWSETDLWPGMVTQTAARGIPMLMFNARLDARKAARHDALSWFFRPLLRRFTRIYAQSPSSSELLAGLGYAPLIAACSGDIKALAPSLPVNPQDLTQWRESLGSRPVWLLASSHAGEEALALEAQQSLLARRADALLLIVPRDAFRGGSVAQMVRANGMSVSLRSAGHQAEATCQVYVADTMGELGLWYRLASVALIGGSLTPIGGHNPYEALALGATVLSGPHVHNFTDSYARLGESGQAQMVTSAQEVALAVAASWDRLAQAERTRAPGGAQPDAPMPALLADITQHLRACIQENGS